MNQNISNYLDAYLKQETTSYATLLTGAWGCGKTHFIKNYIKHYQEKNPSTNTQDQKGQWKKRFCFIKPRQENNSSTEENKYQFVYISLFGLKEIGAIYEQIFQSLHPVLSSKPIKLVGGILKAATKFAVPVDLNGNGSTDANLNIDLDKLLLWDKQNTKNLFFVFDDLERTLIETKEILGFINNLTEHENCKVILIANEDEIKNENKEIFNSFKEKVVNKSFKVQNDHDEYWAQCQRDKSCFSEEQVEQIKTIFIEKGNENFRTMNQIVDNFEKFSDIIDKKFKENTEFYENLISQFFSLSFSYYQNNSCEKFGEIINEFNGVFSFSLEDWKRVVADFYHDKKELNKKIAQMGFFYQEKIAEKNWVELWHYQQKTSEEFYSILSKVRNEFEHLEYEQIRTVIFVFEKFLFFIEKGIITDWNLDKVREIMYQYLEKYKDNPALCDDDLTILNPSHSDDENVRSIKEEMKKVLGPLREKYRKDSFQNQLKLLVEQFCSDDSSQEFKEFLKRHEHEPILHHFDMSYLSQISKNHLTANRFVQLLSQRYSEFMMFNGKRLAEVLKDELPIVKAFAEQLNHAHANATNPFDKLRFQEIKTYLDEIIKRFD